MSTDAIGLTLKSAIKLVLTRMKATALLSSKDQVGTTYCEYIFRGSKWTFTPIWCVIDSDIEFSRERERKRGTGKNRIERIFFL